MPPDSGYSAASRAEETALQYAIAPATASPRRSVDPAARAAGASAANTPAPIIELKPMTTASRSPSRRASLDGVATAVTAGAIPEAPAVEAGRTSEPRQDKGPLPALRLIRICAGPHRQSLAGLGTFQSTARLLPRAGRRL